MLLIVIVVGGIAGGVLYWRGIIGHPKAVVANDPTVVYPFAERLMKVNALAHKRIVTNAEYHDSDSGQRYFVAIVTSCKDLDALWSIKKGVLESEVEAPLRLKSDFEIFSFVEYFQQGQWGVGSCDGTT